MRWLLSMELYKKTCGICKKTQRDKEMFDDLCQRCQKDATEKKKCIICYVEENIVDCCMQCAGIVGNRRHVCHICGINLDPAKENHCPSCVDDKSSKKRKITPASPSVSLEKVLEARKKFIANLVNEQNDVNSSLRGDNLYYVLLLELYAGINNK